MTAGSRPVTLSFPNQSRSFDEARNRIRFWGYDSAIEISFFVEADALHKLVPDMGDAETGYLKAFDDSRERIHEIAEKVYMRGHGNAHSLAAADF